MGAAGIALASYRSMWDFDGEPIVNGPTDPRPWTDETNDLAVAVVQQAWDDLLRPAEPKLVLTCRCRSEAEPCNACRRPVAWSLAEQALDWLLRDTRFTGVPLGDVWDWLIPSRLYDRALARFESRLSRPCTVAGGQKGKGHRRMVVARKLQVGRING